MIILEKYISIPDNMPQALVSINVNVDYPCMIGELDFLIDRNKCLCSAIKNPPNITSMKKHTPKCHRVNIGTEYGQMMQNQSKA
jgi:hypothetical protein